jgi:hypothetical protein
MQALNINVRDKEAEVETEESVEKGYVPYGVSSFAELDASREAEEATRKAYSITDDFMGIVYSVLSNPEITRRVTDEYQRRDELCAKEKENIFKRADWGQEKKEI